MQIEFKATKRDAQGTGASRRLRRAGRIPGILYGGAGETQPVSMDHNELYHLLRKEAFHASVLSIEVDGAKEVTYFVAVGHQRHHIGFFHSHPVHTKNTAVDVDIHFHAVVEVTRLAHQDGVVVALGERKVESGFRPFLQRQFLLLRGVVVNLHLAVAQRIDGVVFECLVEKCDIEHITRLAVQSQFGFYKTFVIRRHNDFVFKKSLAVGNDFVTLHFRHIHRERTVFIRGGEAERHNHDIVVDGHQCLVERCAGDAVHDKSFSDDGLLFFLTCCKKGKCEGEEEQKTFVVPHG